MSFLKFLTINLTNTTNDYKVNYINLDTIITEGKSAKILEKDLEGVLTKYKLINQNENDD